jgi:hypothetical protein
LGIERIEFEKRGLQYLTASQRRGTTGSGVLLSRMDHIDDLNCVSADPVDQNIIGMHHGLACSVNPAGAIEEWVFGKPFRTAFDGSQQPLGSWQISLSDIADDRRQI